MAEPESDSVVEVEFRLEDPRHPLVVIPERAGCRTRVEQIVPRGEDTYAVFHYFEGAPPDRVVELIDGYDSLEARLVDRRDDGGTVEIIVSNPDEQVVVTLTDAGAIPREIRSANGVATVVAEVSSMYCVSDVVDNFLTVHPSAEVVARRQKAHAVPMFTRREFEQTVEERLTPRQKEVLRTAYAEGFFDWPRERSGEEIADELDVANSTFSQHLRLAEQKIFSLLFSENR